MVSPIFRFLHMALDKPERTELLEQVPDKVRLKRGLSGIIRDSDVHCAALRHNQSIVETGYLPLTGKPDLTADQVWKARRACPREEMIDPWRGGEHDYNTNILTLPESERAQWWGLYKFLDHDISHIDETSIGEYAMQMAFALRGEGEGSWKYMQHILPKEQQIVIQRALQRFPSIYRQIQYPHKFAKAVAEIKMRKMPSELEQVDLHTMLDTIMTSIQLRFVFDDYVISTPNDRQPERNELILDLSPSQLETSPAMIWSVLYNLIKNAAKEVSSEERTLSQSQNQESDHDLTRRFTRGKLPEKPIKLHVKMQEIEGVDATIIHIADSGEGLRVEEIMDSLKGIISQELLQESDLKVSVKRILGAWAQNPFAVRALRMGDVYDLAGLARVSGFATNARIGSQSSGLGLWGATYLTKKMGGEIVYTNTVNGGALFTVIIPNHYFTERSGTRRGIRSKVRSIRKGLISGKAHLDTLPLAA